MHNDDPADGSCRELVDALGDPRITLFDHERNMGAVRSFYFCWNPIPNEFMSLLEDDNWWEATFLENMLSIMDAHPEVHLAWANMNLWRERPGNLWEAEGAIWEKEGSPLQFFWESTPRQMMEPLHSQGAMLVRANGPHMVPHPDSTPLFMIEALRERRIKRPLVLHRRPLANFAITIATARKEDPVEKIGGQALLVHDFLKKNNVSRDFIRQAWRVKWWSGRYALRSIIIGSILSGRLTALLAAAFGRELLFSAVWFLRHPVLTARIARYVLMDKQISMFLQQAENKHPFGSAEKVVTGER